MPFQVKLENIAELHECIVTDTQPDQFSLTQCTISSDVINSIRTYLFQGSICTITTKIDAAKEKAQRFLPENLETVVGFRETSTTTPGQLVGNYGHGNVKVSANISQKIDAYTVNVTVKKDIPPDQFQKLMEDYGQVITGLINAISAEAQSEAPNVTFTIAENLPKLKPKDPVSEILGKLGSSNDLDELERKIRVTNPGVLFSGIGGCRHGKREILRIYYDIVSPELALFCGRDPNQQGGYLLLGEAGNGKTFLVEALATKLIEELGDKVRFYNVNYSDITSIYRGGEAQSTAKIFELVKRNEEAGIKTLLFLDEIHLIGTRGSGNGPKDEALDTLLAQLAGLRKYQGLTVIGSTYWPLESLDPALVRPGRLSNKIVLEKPNTEERAEIFAIYLQKKAELAARNGNSALFSEVEAPALAALTDGYNGSGISGLVDSVIRYKEDQLRARIVGAQVQKEDFPNYFQPITLEDFRTVLATYVQPVRSSNKLGF